MNREIKFRIYADNKFYNKCLVGNTNNTHDEKWTCPMVWLEKEKEWVNCDNGIICQYTGLHDKNGKEIYEGDIVGDNKIKWIVKWNKHRMGFSLYPTTEQLYDEMPINVENKLGFKIFGNIYDNPELLGGK